MKKVSNVQKKTNAAQKGEQLTANFRLPLFKSSVELAKKYEIKCEMVKVIVKDLVTTNPREK